MDRGTRGNLYTIILPSVYKVKLAADLDKPTGVTTGLLHQSLQAKIKNLMCKFTLAVARNA